MHEAGLETGFLYGLLCRIIDVLHHQIFGGNGMHVKQATVVVPFLGLRAYPSRMSALRLGPSPRRRNALGQTIRKAYAVNFGIAGPGNTGLIQQRQPWCCLGGHQSYPPATDLRRT